MSNVAALEIDDLAVDYSGGKGEPAVGGVSLAVAQGETLGLVGESGSGKSSIGLAALGLIPTAGGSIRIDGHQVNTLRGAALRRARDRASMIFQSSSASLNPRRTVGWSLCEPLLARRLPQPQMEKRREELLDDVGLPAGMHDRFPHELSGGQKQRVGIARALAADPVLLICDEPTSALDVSVQAQIVNLLIELQESKKLALLFITHDLAVVEAISHRIAVLHHGRVVEQGDAGRVLHHPTEPYTQRLLNSVPKQMDEG